MTETSGDEPARACDNPPVVSLREFRFPEDYPAVFSLWEMAGSGIHIRRSDQPNEIEKKIRRDPDLFLVAEIEDRIVGTVLGGFDGRRGMMYHLAVDKEFQELGIGTQLMEQLETRLREKGCLRYYLLVTADNHQAMHFYEQRGWQRMDLYAYGKDLV